MRARPVLTNRDSRNVRFVASMAVQARRAMGKAEAAIRSEALAVGARAIEKHVGDQGEQETWLAELQAAVDCEIVRTRPAEGGKD